MTRFARFAFYVLACAFFVVPAGAADPPKKLTPEERKELESKWEMWQGAANQALPAGKFDELVGAWRECLKIARQLYPDQDAPLLATSLENLAFVLHVRGKYADAEPLFREALAMQKRQLKGDHPTVVANLTMLAFALNRQGKYADAEPLDREALDTNRRLYKGDHQNVSISLNNLATGLMYQGRYTDAEPFHREALEMQKRLQKGKDHPHIALCLNNLATGLTLQRRYADAERLDRDALDMCRRLYEGDNPYVLRSLSELANVLLARGNYADAERLDQEALDMCRRLYMGRDNLRVAFCLSGLAFNFLAQGKYAAAEPLCRDALDMYKRLFGGDHPHVAASLNNLAALYQAQEKYADAEPPLLDALAMNRRLIASYAGQKAEGESLTLIASLPLTRDCFLSNALKGKSDPNTTYAEVWASKGAVARIYEQRHQAARAAATDSKAAKLLAELTDARHRRAELILAPVVKDPATREKRGEDIKSCEKKIAELDESLRPLLPTIARAENLASAKSNEIQKMLPAEAAVVELIHYTFIEFDKNKPGKVGEKRTERYLAFVVTKDKVAWIGLDTAAKIEAAVKAWRDAIVSGKEFQPTIPATVRELVWEKVRTELPANVKTVYVCPDAALCRVPWGALPGDKPGTILLEDFAIATIPHAPFLLDKLWPQDPLKNPPTDALVVGGVKYDAEPTVPLGSREVLHRGGPLVKLDAKLGWSFLPGTAAEAIGVTGAATSKKLAVNAITDDKATTSAVLAALPKVKYAHFATHGFFADPSFRSVFQLDEKDYEMSRRGERIGRAANSPLVMTGLVFAGANNPKMAGRGIVTGEALIDLDLSGLELAVLSACETGLGDVAGGEGTFGLQRAFHIAGARDVIASLWKVPDQSTAALMALFYRNLWTQNLSPMESLRQAQLEIYRNPGKIADLAKGFRGKFEVVPGAAIEPEPAPTKDGKTHPRLWAAFTLSGPGR